MSGTFTVNLEGTIITISEEDSEDSTAEISFKDKNLRLHIFDDETEYIFQKKE